VDTVWVAVIVGVAGIIGPGSLAWFNARQTRHNQQMNFLREDAVAAKLAARQDEIAEQAAKVAEQAAEAARLLTARQDAAAAAAATTAELLLAANERVAAQSRDATAQTNGKLAQIHELVNSTLTAAMTAELVALEQQRELMEELGRPATKLDDINRRIKLLTMKIADRGLQTEIADALVVNPPPDDETGPRR
jgi:membrane-bound lytic murein transglycosylase